MRTDMIRTLADAIEGVGHLVGVDGVDGARKTVVAGGLAAELLRRGPRRDLSPP